MRHSWSISDSPDLPIRAFRKALGKNRPETLEGGKGGAPSAPDPYVTTDAQSRLNKETALYNKALNAGNYSNPFGYQSTGVESIDPITGAPIYRTDVGVSGPLQGLLSNAMGQAGSAQGMNPYLQESLRGFQGSLSGLSQDLGSLGQSLTPQDAAQAQQRGQEAAYRAQTQYLDPQFAQREQSLQAQLAAQGLAPGSQAYSNAMLNFGNERQRAYSDAANQSVMTGSQLGTQNLQNQLAGINTKAGLFGQIGGNIGQQAGLTGQQAQLSQIPLSQLGSLASLIPGYTGTAQSGMNPADIASAMNNQYQGQLGQYNARQQSSNANTAALAGLAGTAAMMFF